MVKIIRQGSEQQNQNGSDEDDGGDSINSSINTYPKTKAARKSDKSSIQPQPSSLSVLPNFAPVRVFQCSSCHQQGTYKWVVERHIRAKHPDQANVHVIELPAELSVRLQKISPPLKRFRCSLCPLQSKHNWVVIRVCNTTDPTKSNLSLHLIAYQAFPYITNSDCCRHSTRWQIPSG